MLIGMVLDLPVIVYSLYSISSLLWRLAEKCFPILCLLCLPYSLSLLILSTTPVSGKGHSCDSLLPKQFQTMEKCGLCQYFTADTYFHISI